MTRSPNIKFEIQNSNVYVYTMPYNYNNTDRRRSTDTHINSNQEPNPNMTPNPNINPIQNPNINPIQNPRSTLITPTDINGLQNQTNSWINSLNRSLNSFGPDSFEPDSSGPDSSGVRNPLSNITEALESTFHIPVEQLHFEIVDNLPQRGSSINSLLDGTTLCLASQIMDNENDTCAICRQVYNPDDIVRKINSCGHFFHSSCVEQWLRNNSNCPVCRIGI